ncbi:MAG: hypothetical protein PHN74_03155 [Candidatus Pacebacteria bacterium]|nr:hypothetical protein [Candidatus Paceibacterota bacterium]
MKELRRCLKDSFEAVFFIALPYKVPLASLVWYLIGLILWAITNLISVFMVNLILFFVIYFLVTVILITTGMYSEMKKNNVSEGQIRSHNFRIFL